MLFINIFITLLWNWDDSPETTRTMKKKMRHALGMAATLALVAGLVACGDKKENQDDNYGFDSPQRTEDNHNTVIRLSAVHLKDSVRMSGNCYTYAIERMPMDSVIITDEEGYKTQDNSILLTIQKNGTPFFERRFTRSAFHIHVDDSYYQQCILLGMNFDRTTDYGLRFIASIGKGADSEDYKPYAVTVGADGSINITEHDLYEDDEVARFEDEGV